MLFSLIVLKEVKAMVRYGSEFLQKLLKYYSDRLSAARHRGFDQPTTQYHWLYEELALRVETLDQTTLFMSLLPRYLQCSDTETTMDFATRYVEAWFTEKAVGEMPHDAKGQSVYFSQKNPYWVEVERAGDSVSAGIDEKDTQARIGEYVICCLRFFFYMREHQFRSIDRDKFDGLMAPADGQTSAMGA